MLAYQIMYHDASFNCFRRMSHRLQVVQYVFMLRYFLTLLIFFFHASWIAVIPVVSPALGGACRGLIASGEFQKLADQSGKMFSRLSDLNFGVLQGREEADISCVVTAFYELVTGETHHWRLTLHDKDIQVAQYTVICCGEVLAQRLTAT